MGIGPPPWLRNKVGILILCSVLNATTSLKVWLRYGFAFDDLLFLKELVLMSIVGKSAVANPELDG